MYKILFFAAFTLTTLSLPAYAQKGALVIEAEEEVSAIEKKCAEEAFSPSQVTTAQMYEGASKFNQCLENVLKEKISSFFRPEEEKIILQQLDNVIKDAKEYYWTLYNKNIQCICPFNRNLICSGGTIAPLYANDSRSNIVRQLLIDTIINIKREKVE